MKTTMPTKTLAALFFLRDLLLGTAALALIGGGILLMGKIYVLFQPDPSHFFLQGTTPGTWIYLAAAAIQAVLLVFQCLFLVGAAAFGVLALKGAGECVRDLWRRR